MRACDGCGKKLEVNALEHDGKEIAHDIAFEGSWVRLKIQFDHKGAEVCGECLAHAVAWSAKLIWDSDIVVQRAK